MPDPNTDVSRSYLTELTMDEIAIVECDATELVEKIRAGVFKCVDVIRAYCHAATIAQDYTNCLTEVFYDEAISRARELDKHMEKTGQPVGPLHGLPVSIKDHIMVKGKDTSSGYVAWCYNTEASEDAVAVNIFRQAGAVLYVKTNNPQTLLVRPCSIHRYVLAIPTSTSFYFYFFQSLETDNNIYGRTSHPKNRNLTSGGSSGRESALIAMHGSPLGLGTDIGGSIVRHLIHRLCVHLKLTNPS